MEQAIELVVVRDFATALLIGALVGIEREKHKAAEGNLGVGGIRTFALIALVGAVSAWLSRELGTPWVFVAGLALVAGTLVAAYLTMTRTRPDDIGITTEAAAMTVCLLGGMAVLGHPGLAAALGIVTAALLAYKQPLHGMVGKINREELLRRAAAADRLVRRAAAAAAAGRSTPGARSTPTRSGCWSC